MFLVKEHPDPGSKDPEEEYPKFGLLDQVSWLICACFIVVVYSLCYSLYNVIKFICM